MRLVSQAIKESLSPWRAGQLNEKSLDYCRDQGGEGRRDSPYLFCLGGGLGRGGGGQNQEIEKGRKESEKQRVGRKGQAAFSKVSAMPTCLCPLCHGPSQTSLYVAFCEALVSTFISDMLLNCGHF